MIVLITGATSGIGKACASIFARNKYNLILNGRREDRLTELAEQLAGRYGTVSHLLPFDVRDRAAVNAAVESLPQEWKQIDLLINNAGLALGLAPLPDGDADDWDTMIDTNIRGLLYVSKAVASMMRASERGHIINIGSIAGKEVYPDGGVYCATKHAVDALSRAMRIDLLPYRVKVTAVNPGAVETEFSIVRFKGDAGRAKSVYKGFEPLAAEDIAETVYFAASRPPHVNIDDITVMPAAQAGATRFNRND
ncbi:NADP-dependent 3-hydroxy acid dehydrogenase YdfG [Anseongella ginsenosidimutans]|uniref:NADP-dependent 3-hydroxy acid dehydrogenase YdfG n=2 Tax=Anseongella ginsenosidimutans TaxID=496056 RepID=A0A4R3KXZ5_9SPHI|nr:NADP-dependent 3-hydroxy acid dehydrogenase YdfG [Anseongella ginsenosidimutans]